MTLLATSAFAPDFAHTAAVGPAADYDLLPADTLGVPTPCNVASGTYRMCLAPSASDFLRASQAAINARMALEGSTNTVAFTLSAAGILTITFAAALSSSVTFADGVWQRLGLASSSIALSGNFQIIGTRPVWHLALLSSTKHGPWLPQQAGGTEQTTGGRVYAIAATLTSWQRKHAVSFQPTTPAQRAAQGADATALLPAPEHMGALGSTATAREWSVLDVLYGCRNAACGLALDNWQTVRTSTSERFYYGYVAGESLLSPALTAPDETWDAWADWTLSVVLPTSGASITRA